MSTWRMDWVGQNPQGIDPETPATDLLTRFYPEWPLSPRDCVMPVGQSHVILKQLSQWRIKEFKWRVPDLLNANTGLTSEPLWFVCVPRGLLSRSMFEFPARCVYWVAISFALHFAYDLSSCSPHFVEKVWCTIDLKSREFKSLPLALRQHLSESGMNGVSYYHKKCWKRKIEGWFQSRRAFWKREDSKHVITSFLFLSVSQLFKTCIILWQRSHSCLW